MKAYGPWKDLRHYNMSSSIDLTVCANGTHTYGALHDLSYELIERAFVGVPSLLQQVGA